MPHQTKEILVQSLARLTFKSASTFLRHAFLTLFGFLLPLFLEKLALLISTEAVKLGLTLFLLLLLLLQRSLLGLFILNCALKFSDLLFAGGPKFANYLGAEVSRGNKHIGKAEEVGEERKG